MTDAEHKKAGDGTALDWSGEGDAIHKALSHPIRRAILLELGNGGEMSASKVSARLELDGCNTVSYHMRELTKRGCIELIDERPVSGKGAIEKFYRLKDEHRAAVLPQSALSSIAARLGRADGSPYATLSAIADIVRSTGRAVTLPGEESVVAGVA